jgi:hypothetical protein
MVKCRPISACGEKRAARKRWMGWEFFSIPLHMGAVGEKTTVAKKY